MEITCSNWKLLFQVSKKKSGFKMFLKRFNRPLMNYIKRAFFLAKIVLDKVEFAIAVSTARGA